MTLGLLFTLEARARRIIYRSRSKFFYLQQLKVKAPVETFAWTRVEVPIFALPDGQVLETEQPSQLVSELIEKRIHGDLFGFRQILAQCNYLHDQEAFNLYKDALLSRASDFKAEVLSFCRPILISPRLVKFALRHLNFLPDILQDFGEERRRLEVKLLEETMASVIDEAGLLALLQQCSINAPLSNGFPFIFHVIFHAHLPEYFLKLTLEQPNLDLYVGRAVEREDTLPALWSDLPLLTHAWLYNEQAHRMLQERIPITQTIPSAKQILQMLF